MKTTYNIPDEESMMALGAELARECSPGSVIYLQGELGAGKTTLTRGFLRFLGYGGVVRSPTYTLIQSYELMGREIHHLDLYRLQEPEELLELGVEDLLDGVAILLIEWPERALNLLPAAQCTVQIDIKGRAREVDIRMA